MIPQAHLDHLAGLLVRLDGVHNVDQARDLEAAKKQCSAQHSATVVLFRHKYNLEVPKDWLNPQQYCDHEYGLLISEKHVNRPRKSHSDDALYQRIITALIGVVLDEHSTPLRLKAAEHISATAPQSQFLLLFSSRTVINLTHEKQSKE